MKKLTSWAPSLVSAVILVGVMSFEAPIALMAQAQNLFSRVTRLESDLEAETLDRQDADTSEATARQAADEALDVRVETNGGDITALDGRVTTNEGDIAALGTGVAALEARQLNPLQVALLRWYEASEAGNDFAVGNQSSFVAFDGANIWVTNQFDGTVSKLRASDGMTLGTFAVGNGPRGVAFDGANIWVTNPLDGTVSKLRASNGLPLGTFDVGVFPILMAFDGANIWVANALSDTVSKR